MDEIKEIKGRDEQGRFLPGTSGNPGGIPVGTKHRATAIKEAFFDAFEKTGGIDKLIAWIEKTKSNRRAFYLMLLSILPKETELSGEIKGEETKIIVIRNNKSADEPSRIPDELHL